MPRPLQVICVSSLVKVGAAEAAMARVEGLEPPHVGTARCVRAVREPPHVGTARCVRAVREPPHAIRTRDASGLHHVPWYKQNAGTAVMAGPAHRCSCIVDTARSYALTYQQTHTIGEL